MGTVFIRIHHLLKCQEGFGRLCSRSHDMLSRSSAKSLNFLASTMPTVNPDTPKSERILDAAEDFFALTATTA